MANAFMLGFARYIYIYTLWYSNLAGNRRLSVYIYISIKCTCTKRLFCFYYTNYGNGIIVWANSSNGKKRGEGKKKKKQ